MENVFDFDKIEAELKASVVKTKKYIGINANTIKTYMAKIKYLDKQMVLNEGLNDYLESNYPKLNSRCAYQVAIMGVAKHSQTFAVIIGKEIVDTITKSNETLVPELKYNATNQTKSEKEEINWVSLKDLKKIHKEKFADFSVQDNLLISMYTLIPPVRLDLGQVLIVRSDFIDEKTNLPVGVSENQNYIVITKRAGRYSAVLNLNEYKTERTYGAFKEKLPKPITDLIIKLPIEQTHLFSKKSGGAFASPETFGVYLRSVFYKLTGKNMSVDILRHIYITEFRKGEKSTVAKQELARKMMNSVEVQTDYMRP
jgi:uncharacterized protein YjgD (DUF1641 family)